MKTAPPALIIFIRNPVPGKVKTRLAAETGNEKALEIYRQLLAHTRQTAMAVNAVRYVFYADYINPADEWMEPAFCKQLQTGEDLGSRMQQAFSLVLEKHPKAVIIGSDCFALRGRHIQAAFDKLEENDVVIGPAEDGGYYLLALKNPLTHIFQQIAWGTAAVLAQTRQALQQTGETVCLLEPLHDIDTLADARRAGLL